MGDKDAFNRVGWLEESVGHVDPNRIRSWFGPYVDGIEVTQAIQYYRASSHLTDASDRGTDNCLGLAAYKPARVRVYVRSGFLRSATTVTGQLVVQRQRGIIPVYWEPVGTYTPNGTGTAVAETFADYATERGSLAWTLNFVLPADALHGRLRVRAVIWIVGGSAAAPNDTHDVFVDATLQQTLRVRGILVSYNGPNASGTVANMNLAAPTVANLQASCGNALTVYPVESTGVFSSGGTISWSTPLTGVATSPGGCSQEWLDLNVAVAQARANDGNRADVLYVGLLPSGVPIANVGGCNSSGVSAVPDGQQWTMAHELGHAVGLSHGPCGTPGDPSYPAYEPYDPANTPMASLGEYGLDVNNGTIHPPARKDFMSYCGPVWISLYHYLRLYNNSALDPRWVDVPRRPHILYDPWLWPWEYIPDPPSWEVPSHFVRVMTQPVISIAGIVSLTGEVRVASVMRVRAVPKLQHVTPTNMVAELVGAGGKVVSRAVVMQTHAHGAGCTCGGGHEDHGGHGSPERGYAFQALLSDVEPGSALRIVRVDAKEAHEAVELWRAEPNGTPPRVRAVTARVQKGHVTVRWQAKASAGRRFEFSIQFSKDRGVSWNGLAAGLTETNYDSSAADLPSGSIVFRVLAHDGFYTAFGNSKAVRIPPRPPIVAIVHPYDGRSYQAGMPLRLAVSVNTHVGARNPKLDIIWYVDRTRVGTGLEVWIDAPKAGRHRCRAVARDDGGVAETTVTFTTEGEAQRR